MTFSCIYVSGACNQSTGCIDWWDELICYGVCNAVLIYNKKDCHTLTGHKGRVNCVRGIRNCGEKHIVELVSGSVDNTIILWRRLNDKEFFLKQVIIGHNGAVTALDVYNPTSWFNNSEVSNTILVSASADSTVKLWNRQNIEDDFSCIQTISYGYGFALNVKLAALPFSKEPLLAVAGDDSKVHLYAKDDSDCDFEEKLVIRGHDDWVRGLDFAFDDDGDLMLVSSSQDTFLRLWRISKEINEKKSELDTIKLKENIFNVKGTAFVVLLESVMAGHEGWVYSVQWHPKILKEGHSHQPMIILSASIDKTMILWHLDEQSALWSEKVRIGEVGGNSLGFYDALFSPDGLSVFAHGYQGSFHMWHFQSHNNSWEPGVAIRGHFNEVLDIAWDPKAQYLLSCSDDKTTRLHAPWKQNSGKEIWCEIARPQIHGYEITCLASLGTLRFASGADEKIVRIFSAPKNFVENFKRISDLNIDDLIDQLTPQGASVPSLGLSNKAVFSDDLLHQTDPDERHVKDQYPEFYFTSVTLSEPPTEEVLLQNTLWPEIQKLYGHGYEVFCLASNYSGTILASACKASKSEDAVIILWKVATWKQMTKLEFHTLTVTQMAFSPDDQYLLSVSRDRAWALYSGDAETGFRRIANSDKKTGIHSRIIWACAWSHDSLYFATASRDKKVAVWKISTTNVTVESAGSPLETEDSATAVDFAPLQTVTKRYLLGVGLQNGIILLYSWIPNVSNVQAWHLFTKIEQQFGHHLTVKRLKFSPQQQTAETQYLKMATCGSDHLVRIYELKLDMLS